MAGHNKWSQIRHKKAKEDSKRGYAFTKIIKEITVSAREGGGDPASNPHLRTLLEKAKSINMPIENSQRAIKRGIGELPGVNYEEFVYEGYGPDGIAVIVETLSDNKNRTVAELRRLFSSNNGSLGETGSVSWMFEKMGAIHLDAEGKKATEDELLELLFEHDVNDLQVDETTIIYCDPKALEPIKQTLESNGFKIENAGLEWVAKTNVELAQNSSDKAVDFLSSLHDHDDVKNVYTNLG